MHKQLIFMDDSGDPGFKKTSSSHFVMAAVVFDRGKEATRVSEKITKYRKFLGWKEEHEFKFRKAPREIKRHFLEIVNEYDFRVYAVYIDKQDFSNFPHRETLYNWAIKELLAIIPLKRAVIKIDGKYNKQYKRYVAAYIRQKINRGKKMRIEKIDTDDSAQSNFIQLADIVAGSINRSFHTEKTDADDYIFIIRKKIVKLERLDFRK